MGILRVCGLRGSLVENLSIFQYQRQRRVMGSCLVSISIRPELWGLVMGMMGSIARDIQEILLVCAMDLGFGNSESCLNRSTCLYHSGEESHQL